MTREHSCKRVAELLSQRLDEPLRLSDRILLRVHLALCGNCRNVQVHLREMRKLSHDLFAIDAQLGDRPAKDRANDVGLPQG